ncbi:MAG TPA: type II secretion system protein GspD [Methylomirabilota bacterium]|nr:type II secretion system protein GspD [Methylomirabilota bacterium]
MARSTSLIACNLPVASLILLLTGCQGTRELPPAPAVASREAPVSPDPAVSPPESTVPREELHYPDRITYSARYDEEIQEIFELAKRERWEQAEARAIALYEQAPQDSSVERVLSWVSKQRQAQRDKALEDRIREIEAQNSVFNPTIPGLLKESKDRGLPPRKDLRDAIQQLESTPYIPESFGRTNRLQGPLFDIDTPQGRMVRVLEREVSVHLDDVTLESIIFDVGQAEGINFIADKSLPAFQQKLSINVEKVQLGELLRYISRNLGVQFQVGEDLVWIVDAENPRALMEETRFYRLRKGFIVPAAFGASEVERTTVTVKDTVTVTERQKIEKFVNDGAPDDPAIETAIDQFFTGSKYMIDYERNLIVATGTPEQLAVLERLIQEFDKTPQQVLIEARFITVTEAAFLQLGTTWETGRDILTSGRTPTDFTGLGTGVGLGLQEVFTNILGRPNLSATLTALEQSGESHTLSAPRLTLVNNLPATISDGKVQYYYEEYTVKQQITERATASSLVPSGKPTKLTSGVSLEVLASIGGDGESILLALKPQVNQDVQLVTFATISDRDATGNIISTFEIKLPESRTQELATRVVVKSGQTVVMGGVLEREQRTFVESVPVLSSIPIIGAAFRKRTEVDRPRYLLVFVTATLVSDSGEFLSYDGAVIN